MNNLIKFVWYIIQALTFCFGMCYQWSRPELKWYNWIVLVLCFIAFVGTYVKIDKFIDEV